MPLQIAWDNDDVLRTAIRVTIVSPLWTTCLPTACYLALTPSCNASRDFTCIRLLSTPCRQGAECKAEQVLWGQANDRSRRGRSGSVMKASSG